MKPHIIDNARFLQFHYSTVQAARYLRGLGCPVETAVKILTKQQQGGAA